MMFNIKFVNVLMSISIGVIGAGCSLFGIRSQEQPAYDVLLKTDNNEIRKYQSYIVAKTVVSGTFEEAQSRGFKILAGYIFGKNKSKQKIAMTAPVVQKSDSKSEKIAMTAPVTIAPGTNKKDDDVRSWVMTFSMPSKFSIESLPVPDDSRVTIQTVRPRFIAAHVFTGFWSEARNKDKADELIQWLEAGKQYKVMSQPMFAGYNPPWTLPFLRRNEILIEVEPIN